MSSPESSKLIIDPLGAPWIVQGRPDTGYITHRVIVLPGQHFKRSWQAVEAAANTNPDLVHAALAAIIERALDAAIAAGISPIDTEMLSDEVADALRWLPAAMADWVEAS
jgi:hypothetical protein